MSLSQSIEASLAVTEQSIEEILLVQARQAADILDGEVEIMRLKGMDDDAIFDSLEADLQAKGRVFGQIDTAARGQVIGSVIKASNDAQDLVYQASGMSDERRWVVVNLTAAATTRPCPDCPTRQGQVETMEEWERQGLPGSGWSVCKAHCYCLLVPVVVEVDRVDIIRER